MKALSFPVIIGTRRRSKTSFASIMRQHSFRAQVFTVNPSRPLQYINVDRMKFRAETKTNYSVNRKFWIRVFFYFYWISNDVRNKDMPTPVYSSSSWSHSCRWILGPNVQMHNTWKWGQPALIVITVVVACPATLYSNYVHHQLVHVFEGVRLTTWRVYL